MVILRSNRNTNAHSSNAYQANQSANSSDSDSSSHLSGASDSEYSDQLSLSSEEPLNRPPKRQRLHSVSAADTQSHASRLSEASDHSDMEDFIAQESELEYEADSESELESLADESQAQSHASATEGHSLPSELLGSDEEGDEEDDEFVRAFANRLMIEVDMPTVSERQELEGVYGKPLAKEIWGYVLNHVDRATDNIVREYLRMTQEVTELGKEEHMPPVNYFNVVCQAQKTLDKIQKMPRFSEKIRSLGQSEAELTEQDYHHIQTRFGEPTADRARRITRLAAREAAAQAEQATDRHTLELDLKALKSLIHALANFNEVLSEAKIALMEERMKQKVGVTPIPGTSASLIKLDGSLGLEDLIVSKSVEDEIKKIVDRVANHDSYKQSNIPMVNGLLLSGPPGTGKTHSARIIASLVTRTVNDKNTPENQKEVTFIECNGADFTGPHYGEGVQQVNRIMQAARSRSTEELPAFLFIDEFDALAAKRSNDGDREDNKTLNALLGALDGLVQDRHVVLIAATNHVDKLDAAILRPGRIDMTLALEKPDSEQRLKLLNLFEKKYILEHERPETNILKDLSDPRYTQGYTGAELKELTIKMMGDRIYQANQGQAVNPKIEMDNYLDAMKLVQPSNTTPFPDSVKVFNHTGEEKQLPTLDEPLFDKKDSQALKEILNDYFNQDLNNPFQIKPPNKLFLQTNSSRKMTLAHAIAGTTQRPVIFADVRRMESKWLGQSTKNMDNLLEAADNFHIKPAVLILDNLDTLVESHQWGINQQMLSQLSKHLNHPEGLGHLMVIGLSQQKPDQTGPLAQLFSHKLTLKNPDAETRQQVLEQKISQEAHLFQPIDTKTLAQKGKDFDYDTLNNWINAAKKIANKRFKNSPHPNNLNPMQLPEALKVKTSDFLESFEVIQNESTRSHAYASMYT